MKPTIAAKIASTKTSANRSLITKYGQNGSVSFSASAFEVRRTSTPVGLLLPVVWNAQMWTMTSPAITNGRR